MMLFNKGIYVLVFFLALSTCCIVFIISICGNAFIFIL